MAVNRFSLHRFISIVKKEFIQVRRDRASFGIGLLMPLMLLFLFGYAINTNVEHLSTGVLDQSKTSHSRELINKFAVTGYFDINYNAASYSQLYNLMDKGEIQVALIIPPDYAYRLEGQQTPAGVQVLINGAEPNAARTALSTAQLTVQNFALTLQMERLARQGIAEFKLPLEIEPRVLYNPDMDSATFNIPGLIGLIMQNVTALLTAFALVREKERGTLEQLIVTPVKPVELILGKLVPYVLIGFFSFSLVLFTGIYWFGVPVKGSLTLLFALGALFLVTTLSIGMLISTVAKTQMQAMLMAFAIFLPSILLSGFIFPRETMPLFVQGIGLFIPLTYFLEILRGIFLKGVSIDMLWQETLILSLFTFLICAVAVRRFNKKLE